MRKRGVKYLFIMFLNMVISFTVAFYIGIHIIYNTYTNNAEKAVSRTFKPHSVDDLVEKNIVDEPKIEKVEEIIEETHEFPDDNSYETRMTSFWADDGSGTGECTGSGLCSWDFGIDEHGWYTYNGKLVVATATTYLANQGWVVGDGVHLYRYYEELILTIDGVEYDAIILDSCGSSMKTDRVDLFVSGGWAVKDTMIKVRRR